MSIATATITEELLVEMLHKKDSKVLPILYEKYSIALHGVIFRILNDQQLAEEQLQECFLKIWNYGSSYDPSKGRLFTWMLVIARNAAYDAVRTKRFKQQEKIQPLESHVSIIEKANSVEMNPDEIGIQELIQELNTKYAKIIDLLYFQGYSQSEAAEELDLPLGTVKTRARTAIQILRNKFK